MKNEHMVPVNIIDIVNKLSDQTIRENERINYILRLEAIRDYCITAINNDFSKGSYKKVFRKN
jgi:hypothetical protein